MLEGSDFLPEIPLEKRQEMRRSFVMLPEGSQDLTSLNVEEMIPDPTYCFTKYLQQKKDL
jgi:hypothetical protein